MAIFAVPTFVLLSHGKTEFSIQKYTSFSKYKGTIFLSYYRQLLSTKCIEIVYSFLEKRKSIVVSFDFAGKKKNYGKAISSFPFLWLYFIIRIYEYDIKVKLFFLSRQVHIGTKYTWEYRRLCQLIAGRSHLSIFNRESRWLLVCRILYLYLWLLVLRGHPILHVPMLNPWLTTRLCFTTSSSSAIFIYDYLILQPKENLMSCCRGALF